MKALFQAVDSMFLETNLMNTKKKNKLVFGVGVNDWEYQSYFKGKPVWQYRMWGGILERCFCEKFKAKKPSYVGVTCDESWVSFKAFIKDVVTIENYQRFYTDKWHIDKDLLFKGNKIYTKDTICFVPHEINAFLTKSDVSRGATLIGVHYIKAQKKYSACVGDGHNKKLHLGTFNSEIEAFNAYKINKEKIAKRIANQWKGLIADDAYKALMNYEVDIND